VVLWQWMFQTHDWDASELINLKLKPTRYVTYGDNNRGRILGVGNIGGDDKVIVSISGLLQ